jgi:nicotinate-nucleotide--dimethylbenzimidazole phosphoribosyltransferase
VALEGVSAYPQEVTAQMVLNFLNGGAAINVFSKHVGAEVYIVDAGIKSDIKSDAKNFISNKVGNSTKNFVNGPAMTKTEAEACINCGIKLAEDARKDKVDIIVVGDMGIGNTTVATAIAAACGIELDKLIDIGTVIDTKTLAHKKDIIEKALKTNKPDPKDAIDILSKVGGFCIAQMTGLILKAASLGIPVVIDGFPVTSAALLAVLINPNVKDYLFAGHLSFVKGHKELLKHMGLEPIMKLDMRLGEGTGAVLSLSLIEASIKMLNEMATFESAGVSEGTEVK